MLQTPSPNDTMQRMTGGRALAQMLQAHDCGQIFGMGGFQLLPFYEGARSLGLKHFLINDERCGAFAADAYARVSGRPGVVDATLGPGATNLVTGLAEALNAGTPLIAIVGDAHREHAWKNMTQEARQVDVLRPVAKELIRIEHPKRIPELLRRAYQVATSGRPGPVVVDVPEDVAHAEWEYGAREFHADPATTRYPARRARPAAEDIDRAARILARAERPVLLVGGGVHLSHAYEALLGLAEAEGVPVAHTMSGKGSIACASRLNAGLFGRYSRIANELIAESDALLVVGCKLGEVATKRYALLPPGVPLIHLDIVAEEIGRTADPEVALWGDAAAGLDDLGAALADGSPARRAKREAYVAEVGARMRQWLEDAKPRLTSDERPINMARLVAELNRIMPADSILVADGGFAAHWTGLLYDTKAAGRGFLPDRGFASIGYGLPGSLGAQFAAPDKAVVGLTGDGGFNMVLGELETARRMNTPFTLVVVNNAASGYVKALQHAVYGQYQSSDLVEMDYAAIARAMGCHGVRVEDPAELGSALGEALAERSRPSVVDVVVTRDPARMLPAVDNRVLRVDQGDRPV
jgi:acetolactate synthase-1/2/3 large subunit